jgi:hypothetical protein
MFGATGAPTALTPARGLWSHHVILLLLPPGTRTSLMALALTALLIGLALLLRSERCGALARG